MTTMASGVALPAHAAGGHEAGPAAQAVACRDCGLPHQVPPMAERSVAECVRCGGRLLLRAPRSIDLPIACYLGALALFYVANAYPIIGISIEGRVQSTTIAAGARALAAQGMPLLGAVVLLAGILVPLLKILGNLYALLSVRLRAHPPGLVRVFRWTQRLRPWAMMEVYLLGLLVAYVKLHDIASVDIGTAAVGFVALILVMLAADANLDPHAVWARVQPQAGPALLRPRLGTVLVGCHACDQLVRLPEVLGGHDACPRCRTRLHRRKPDSVGRTSALLLTAAFLYVPANLLPIMSVTYLGWPSTATILGGIRALIGDGMLPVALLVFFASIVVPILKVVGLGFLIVSVRRRWAWRPRQRTLLYRVIEGIGRWSMVDVFMISILTSLVRLGNLAEVTPERGAIAFAAVVVTTMLAAMTFDPRLIWDAIDERPGHQAAPAA